MNGFLFILLAGFYLLLVCISLENCAMLFPLPEKTVKAKRLHHRLTKTGIGAGALTGMLSSVL